MKNFFVCLVLLVIMSGCAASTSKPDGKQQADVHYKIGRSSHAVRQSDAGPERTA